MAAHLHQTGSRHPVHRPEQHDLRRRNPLRRIKLKIITNNRVWIALMPAPSAIQTLSDAAERRQMAALAGQVCTSAAICNMTVHEVHGTANKAMPASLRSLLPPPISSRDALGLIVALHGNHVSGSVSSGSAIAPTATASEAFRESQSFRRTVATRAASSATFGLDEVVDMSSAERRAWILSRPQAWWNENVVAPFVVLAKHGPRGIPPDPDENATPAGRGSARGHLLRLSWRPPTVLR